MLVQHLVKTLIIPDLNQLEACSVSQEHLDPAGIHNRSFKLCSVEIFEFLLFSNWFLHIHFAFLSHFLDILAAYLAERKWYCKVQKKKYHPVNFRLA